ncbi:MAG: polyhydroxyalkanoate depolymerase [Pseudomonadota bacterium]
MLYHAYQSYADATTPMRLAARAALGVSASVRGVATGALAEISRRAEAGAAPRSLPYALDGATTPNTMAFRRLHAALALIAETRLTHKRPDFGIETVRVGNRDAIVTEEVALDLPFGNLLKFDKDVDQRQPKVLVVAPLSGHFSTLLRNTVRTLLADHEVYITDWKNARDVPMSAGRFGFDDYVSYLIRFLEAMGPHSHIVAVCQPCVQALVATAVMSEQKHPATPLSMTLMAGPIDTRQRPTTVNELATERSIDWFKANLLSTVPFRFKGAGRLVYPGFVQLLSFMSMNLERHRKSHEDLYNHIANGDQVKAKVIRDFYDEYFAVLDLTAEFYIETVEKVFQKAELATGALTYHGAPVDPNKIRRTFLLTVEGGRDDICAVGQTAAAHDLCGALPPHLRRHHLQANVGHYGVFSGRKWEGQIYPTVRNVILSME